MKIILAIITYLVTMGIIIAIDLSYPGGNTHDTEKTGNIIYAVFITGCVLIAMVMVHKIDMKFILFSLSPLLFMTSAILSPTNPYLEKPDILCYILYVLAWVFFTSGVILSYKTK
jgi:hypothetical protein